MWLGIDPADSAHYVSGHEYTGGKGPACGTGMHDDNHRWRATDCKKTKTDSLCQRVVRK